MRRGLVAVMVVAVVAVAMPATGAGATPPPGVQCGQVITRSVTLQTDLTCSGDALTIAADDLTVRLHGHTITSADGTGAGIRLALPQIEGESPCVQHVVVEGGTISGFAAGLETQCYPTVEAGNRISAMTLTGNQWGVLAEEFAVDVDHTTIVGPNGIGPELASGEIHVAHSKIDVTGVSVAGAFLPITIDSSRLDGGRVAITAAGGFGMTISHSTLTGVDLSCWDTAITVLQTRVVGGTGLWGQACGVLLQQDRFEGSGSGLGAGNLGYPLTVIDSVFTDWDTALLLDDGSSRSTITGNTFRHDGTGVACRQDCLGTVSGNTFVDNQGTGLLLTTGTWHVGSNLALRNGGLGIDAEGPDLTVFDDGGNVARRNAPPQCIGVTCSR